MSENKMWGFYLSHDYVEILETVILWQYFCCLCSSYNYEHEKINLGSETNQNNYFIPKKFDSFVIIVTPCLSIKFF